LVKLVKAGTGGALLPTGYLSTQGSRIVGANGVSVRLAGVNWYGFDCTSMVAGGLDRQTLEAICRQIVTMGFNHIRLPFSVQLVQHNPVITRYMDKTPALKGRTSLQIMDAVISAAGRVGLKVVLDSHRSEAGWSMQSNGLWYTRSYSEAAWLSAWRTLIQRYAHDSTVIGCDLRNEPGAPPPDPNAWPRNGGAVWGYTDRQASTAAPDDWAAAAERAGNSILALNPNLLIFVEGVRYDPAGPKANNGVYWPGGNLTGVGKAGGGRRRPVPIRLNLANRLVYSVHDYGPDMYSRIPWSQPASTQSECWSVWDATWGYIVKEGIAPILLGEFGTPNGNNPGDRTPPQFYTDPNPLNPQGAWFTYLVNYMGDLHTRYGSSHWCYWPLNGSQSEAPGRNPSEPDWYGVLNPSWSGVASQPLLAKLNSIM
jgi:endoglucanase